MNPIFHVMEVLKTEGYNPCITTIRNGNKFAAIVLKGSWRDYGICESCGHELEDKRFNLCEKCRERK